MPLHGKIVVIKRSGGDGTEFPLTATCLFGRNNDCDIRIQLPQVSREHCRIDLNENKEVVLTNLSSANPTRVNGEALQQSERLKHGDVITIIDRSFRFEYPPAPTPKKRSSRGSKTETLKVLQDQQDTATVGTGEKRVSEISTDPHLKDAANHDNIQRSLEKTLDMESKEDGSLVQSKTTSPFSDLYQMIKKSLDVKTPRKSSASLLQTPSSRFCSPKPGSVRKSDGKCVIVTEDKSTPKKDEAKVLSGTPESVRKQKKVVQLPSTEIAGLRGTEQPPKSEATSPRRRNSTTPQRFTLCEVIEQVSAQTPKSPVRRRSKEGKPAVTKQQDEQEMASPKTKRSPKAPPRSSEKAEKEVTKKRKSGELGTDLPAPKMKKKRVSFGGFLSPELFDKRLPPDSPLRKGATPRRSLSLLKPKESLLRRASVIGLLKEFDKDGLKKSPNGKRASPKTPTPGKKSPKSRSTSPKAASPGKNSPKSRSTSPKAASPGKNSPKSRSSSPKASPATKSPKSKSPSPKAASPGKNSPKSRSSSPKAASPASRSPRSRSSSPKVASPVKKSPKSKSSSPKAASVGKKSPKSRSPSPKAASPTGKRRSSLGVSCPASQEDAPSTGVTPVKTPVSSEVQTPTVRGRFSVSRISTPSPANEVDAVTDQVPSFTVTPKIPIRRKSMKSGSRKTPSISKSALKVMNRRSGLSRVSMKVANSWANIVKFGETKAPIVAPPKNMIAKKTMKKAVPKPQTPARKLKSLASTGHANSPATIVVGRAHKQKVVHPTGAAPRVVTNTAVFKKNMKMDEDLTGISEMFKTPVNARKRKSVINENSAIKTPAEGLGTSVIEPSVLNTPEEPDEMVVSPLSIASTVKGRQYSREAVQRLLNGDQESSFVGDIPSVETHSECSEEQHTDLKTSSVATPKQKPELPESLTGIRRILKTPRQKAEPVEDLRGKILKTPKQKAEQQECLTGVKRIMKTPRQKTEPLEDIRGKLLKTPKQKPEQQECLTGVKKIFETPKQQAGPIEDLHGKLQKTPKAPEAGDVSFDGVKELLQTPAPMQESKDLSEMTNTKTPDTKSSPMICLTGIKRIMKTPQQKSAPVEDMVGVKRLMRTPREKGEPVEENFGIKRLMKSPRLRGIAPVEDFEGLQELMEEPLTDPTGQLETNEDEDQMPVDGGVDVTKEADFAHGEPQDNEPSDTFDNVPTVGMAEDANEVVSDHLEEPSGIETVSEAAADETVAPEQPKVDTLDENVPEVKSAAGRVTEMDTTVTDPGNDKKSARGRRAKTVESKPVQDKQEAPEPSEEPVVTAPVRGRRGKKTEATAPPAVRQTARGRNAKTTENTDVELTVEESAPQPSKVAPKPRRGRNAKKASEAEIVQEVAPETEMAVEPKGEPSPAVDVDHKANDSAAPLEKAVLMPRRGRKVKQPQQSVPEQQEEPSMQTKDVPQADVTKVDANEACSDQMEVLPSETENKSDAKETILQTPETESLPDVETAEVKAGQVQKKSVRGRRAKVSESKEAEDKQEAAEYSEEPVVTAPVRGRRGKKVEAAAPPAVRQTKRGRNAKSQESVSDQPAVETHLMTEVSTEAASVQTSLINTSQENGSAPSAEEAVVKPVRGRKTKQTAVEPAKPEPEQDEAVSGEHAQPQQPIPATAAKPRRGRKTKRETEEQEVAEDTVVKIETSQQSEPPVSAKRGRNARQEEKMDNDAKTAESQEPVQKGRRTRKTERDHVEPREEVQTIEVVLPEKEEAPVAEPVTVSEQAIVAAKPKRGGRKAKQNTESVTPVESTEVQEVPVVSSKNKPQRGRRGKQASAEAAVTAEDPEHELEATEPAAPVVKPSKARAARSSVKSEISQAIPAKRARRGTAPPAEEANAESTEFATTSVEPAKRGRRAAAKPTTDEATVTSDQANPSKDANNAVVDDTKTSKRSVKWKSDLEVIEIPKVTPVKAVRGRKSKLGDQVESKNVSKDANKPEEEDLSDKVVEAQPAKRARRGATADKAEAMSKVNLKETAEAETQPKTRRGRSAKK